MICQFFIMKIIMKIKLNNNELFIGKVFSYLHATGWNEIVLSITFWVVESGGVVESTRIFRVRDAYVFVIGNLNKECCDTFSTIVSSRWCDASLFLDISIPFHFLSFIIFFIRIYLILSYLFRISFICCLWTRYCSILKFEIFSDFHFIKNLLHTSMLFYF